MIEKRGFWHNDPTVTRGDPFCLHPVSLFKKGLISFFTETRIYFTTYFRFLYKYTK